MCTKEAISGGSWGDSTSKTSPALLDSEYKITPISELLGDYDSSIKSSLEAAAEQYVGEGQRQWEDYYNAFLNCKPPFDYIHQGPHALPARRRRPQRRAFLDPHRTAAIALERHPLLR
jgi:hypothetical protein